MSPEPSLRILYIEDDPSDQARLSRATMSFEAPCELDIVSTAMEGWQLLSEKEYDVLFMDLSMRWRRNWTRTHLDLVNRVRERGHDTIVFVITGSEDEELLSEARQAGAGLVLKKHHAYSHFRDFVHAALNMMVLRKRV